MTPEDTFEDIVEELEIAEGQMANNSYIECVATFMVGVITLPILVGAIIIIVALLQFLYVALFGYPKAWKRYQAAKTAYRLAVYQGRV